MIAVTEGRSQSQVLDIGVPFFRDQAHAADRPPVESGPSTKCSWQAPSP